MMRQRELSPPFPQSSGEWLLPRARGAQAMIINDLKQTCAACQGSGRQAGYSQWGITQINPAGRCRTCEGRGFLLTQLGRDVLDLLRPYIEDMLAAKTAASPAKSEPE